MKKLFLATLIGTILFGASSYACMCSSLSSITTDYLNADFVATVKVIKIYKNKPITNEYYSATIKIIDLYKGEKLKNIYILGNNGGESYNSCGTLINEGETRLIFGKDGGKGFISTFLCTSYYKPLSESYQHDKISQKLSLLKKHANTISFDVKNEIACYAHDFKQIKNEDLRDHFSILKIKIDKDGHTKEITYLTKESEALKAAYAEYFNTKIDWKSRLSKTSLKEGEEATILMEIKPYKS